MFAVFTDRIAISSGDANVKYVEENKCILDQNTRALIVPPVNVENKNCLFIAHKTSFSVFEFRARFTSLLSRSVTSSQLSANYANRR